MGQKVSPISLREFINKITDSRWIANKKDYAAWVAEDDKIRKFIEKKLKKAGLAKVVIERFAKKVVVTIHTSRPGMIIGKNGADIETLRNDIKKLVKNDQVVVNIYEVRRPDLNAQLVAQNIAQQIEGRVSFKRAMKKAVQNAQKAGAQGIKVMLFWPGLTHSQYPHAMYAMEYDLRGFVRYVRFQHHSNDQST